MPGASTEQSREAVGLWDINAEFWNQAVGLEGNKYWKRLQQPSLTRLLAPQLGAPSTPRRALDLACGNGLCARWLASHGETVVGEVWATDGSQAMVEQARSYGTANGRISFEKVDVTISDDFAQLREKAAGGFDIVLMNMALMDVAELEPLATALPTILNEDGVFHALFVRSLRFEQSFVATLLHPVFMTSLYARSIQYTISSETGKQDMVRGKTIFRYLSAEPSKQLITSEQEIPPLLFHRPIHELLAPFFKAGLVMDALEEPNFTEEDAIADRPEATSNFVELPALMAFRLRRFG
ncbi:unnamed protein product [Clonostachys rhizophaga]|uniref:Methyltransferase domain-containing protein n=1 Tax=Clonostachys rhizophaga TaxID=160324 RepID=A0A9N9VN04_9HYPO|nr:unnamed protein product [Clonostachys rhizophaga]